MSKELKVLGARAIVEEIKLEEKTKGGIVIPGREKESTNRGKVIGVGDGAVFEDGTICPMQVKVGDTVIYAHFSGSPIVVEDKTYIILNERDILCVIEE